MQGMLGRGEVSIFKNRVHYLRREGIEYLPVSGLFALSLHHLSQSEKHAANDDQYDAAAQHDTHYSNDHA